MTIIIQIIAAIIIAWLIITAPSLLIPVAITLAPIWLLYLIIKAVFDRSRIPRDAEQLLAAALADGRTIDLPIRKWRKTSYRPLKIVAFDGQGLKAFDPATRERLTFDWRKIDGDKLVEALLIERERM